MLIKDKDILVDTPPKEQDPDKKRKKIKKENTKQSWGDAFDAYLRGITEKYLAFHGRASRLEFWGFAAAAAIISIPLSVLAYYIDMPELPYYFAGVTLIPFAAVFSRRLHDTGRRTAPYLISVFVPVVSLFFIGWYAFALLIVWIIFNVYALSQNSEPEENLYGEPEEDDLLYGSDHQAIIGKFRFGQKYWNYRTEATLGLQPFKFDRWNQNRLFLVGGIGFEFYKTDSKEIITDDGEKLSFRSWGNSLYPTAGIRFEHRFFATGNTLFVNAQWRGLTSVIQNSDSESYNAFVVTVGFNFGVARDKVHSVKSSTVHALKN